MNTYRYKAVSKQGAKVSGVVEGYDEFDAVSRIKENCAFVVDISQVKEKNGILTMELGSKRVKAKSLSVMCSQFSVLIHSGLSVNRIVDIISKQTSDKKLAKILVSVAEDVSAGHSLASSFESHSDSIPIALIETVRAGEESGSLEKSFSKLSAYFEKSYKVKAKVSNALTYPIFVLIVAVGVMIVMMAKVIPTFISIFDDLKTELPLSTVMLINMSKFFQKWYILIIVCIFLLVLAAKVYSRSNAGRERTARLMLKLPVLGKISIMNGASQYANTMSTLMSAGISVSQALSVTSRVMDNYYLSKCTDKLIGGVEAGKSLGQCMEQAACFPNILNEMTSVGEETGALEETLEKTAVYFDNEVETATTKAIAFLEPALLVVTAVIAGFIVISLYLPMFSMYSAM